MKIEFEVKDNKRFVEIIGIKDGVRKVIGNIHTPSSSSQSIKNAIQICGITEAFDLWGCSQFQTKKTDAKSVLNSLETGKLRRVYAKDIQLLFSFDTERTSNFGEIGCDGCFNSPCTCERAEWKNSLTDAKDVLLGTEKLKNSNPYNLKREHLLQQEGLLEYETK